MTHQPTEFETANAQRLAEALHRAEDVLWLVTEGGEEPERACQRVGTTMGATEKTLVRHGRRDDWHTISAARPRSLHTMRSLR